MIALYFGGIIMGILMALIFGKTMFKGEAVPFVMELPNYRLPGAKNVGQLLWEKAKDFLQRAFTVIFVATIVIWFLQTFDPVSYTHLDVYKRQGGRRVCSCRQREADESSGYCVQRVPSCRDGCPYGCGWKICRSHPDF